MDTINVFNLVKEDFCSLWTSKERGKQYTAGLFTPENGKKRA
jgi:hypothetical protein